MLLLIILLTSVISVMAFSNAKISETLSLKPVLVYHNKQVYRAITHSLIHADWAHLLVNMFVLFSFGQACLAYFNQFFVTASNTYFIILYIGSLIFSSLFSIYKHRNNPYYTAVGASGAVMAVVFTSIFFDPWNMLYFFGIIPIPGIVFGFLYMGYSIYMGRKGNDNIGHDAHFFGALFGFLYPLLLNASLIHHFIDRLLMR